MDSSMQPIEHLDYSISLREFFHNDDMKIDVFINKYIPYDLRKLGPDNIYIDDFFKKMCESAVNVKVENKKQYFLNKWVNELLDDKWRPGGSILSGLVSNKKKISLFNCTTIPIDSDSLEGIFEALYSCAKVAAHRQGLGVDFSKLRAKNMTISNSAEISQGPVHWMKLFNFIGNSVGQLGRRPAMLFSLRIDHPDIEDFISCKDDLNEINNANISVQITDDFMKKLYNDSTYLLRYFNQEKNESVEKIIRCKDLISKIAQHAWKTGEPGIQFIDLMKSRSIQEALGYEIVSTNACSEKPLPPYSICGLLSINMEKVPHLDNIEKMKVYLEDICYSVVRFMDNVIEYEIENDYKSPLKKQLDIIKDLREIGIGVTNVHRWLFDQNIVYDSEEAIEAMDTFFKLFRYYVFRATIRLARERGPCPAWSRCRDEGKLESLVTDYLKDVFSLHPDIEKDYFTVGIRNGALLSIAPTGSISMTFGNDTLSSGIEPAIGWYYWRRTRAVSRGKWDYYFVIPSTVKSILLDKIMETSGIHSEDYMLIRSFSGSVLDNNGELGKKYISVIEKYIDPKTLKGVFNVDPFIKLKLIGVVQRYVDGAISVTFNLPANTSVETIENLYVEAHKLGIKGVTVFRDGCREGILFFEFPSKPSVSFSDIKRPEDIQFVFAPKRPIELPAEVYYLLKHHVIVGLFNDKPYEVFIVDCDGKRLPSRGFVKKIKKNKVKKYYLIDESGNHVICLNDSEVANDEIQAITRLVSSNLRHGVPIDFICDQLEKCGSSISSYPKMLSRVLRKYKFLMYTREKKFICPSCGETMIDHDGCVSCLNCGYSKCV